MVIKDFSFTGEFPNYMVQAVLSQDESQTGEPHKLTLGNWDYVSTLNEKELTSLIHIMLKAHQEPNPTEAMTSLIGHRLETASK